MKILITGGAGFIGSHIADALLRNGHEVDIIDNLSTGYRNNVPDGAEFFEISTDDAETKSLIERRNYDHICHYAAQIDLRKSTADPVSDLNNDVVASVKLLEWAVRSNVKHFVYASSGGAIYGEQDYFPADEKHRIKPESPYGLNKWIVERYMNYYNRSHGFGSSALRFANVYGPGQNSKSEAGVIAIFTDTMLRDEKVTINGTGEQTRDFVYISDVVSANLAAIEKRYNGVLNIGTGIETTVNDIYRLLNEIIQNSQDAVHGPPMVGEQLRSVLNWSKAKEELHWSPEVSLKRGLTETVVYFKKKFETNHSIVH